MGFKFEPFSPVTFKETTRSKDCGKHVGYCPNCNLMYGDKEINHPCGRCGSILTNGENDHSDEQFSAGYDEYLYKRQQ